MRSTRSQKAFDIFNYIFLIVVSFTFIFPFWRAIAISLNEGFDAMRGGISFWPRKFTFTNYLVIFSKNDIVSAYRVTILRTLIGTVLAVLLQSLMAYGLSKRFLKGRYAVNIMLLITMFFSGGLIPHYLLYRELKLLDTFWIFIIPSLYSAYHIFIFRTYFRSLPLELEESAKMDGANDLLVFFKIVFPISIPIIASLSLFTAVVHWNDWFAGTIYITKRNLVPMQTLLMRVLIENESSKMIQFGASNLDTEKIGQVTAYTVRMATLVAVMLPILCVYPFVQKYFVKGMMIGSLKG